MLNSQLQSSPSRPLSLLPNRFIKGNTPANFLDIKRSKKFPTQHRNCRIGLKPNNTIVCDLLTTLAEKQTKLKATVTISLPIGRNISSITDGVLLELFSAELDPYGREKPTISAYAHKSGEENRDVKFEAEFVVPPGFGEVGAIFVENELHTEVYLKDIVLDGFYTNITFTCNSWIHSRFDNKKKRYFFTDKSYLPSETPSGLVRLREEELLHLRGNGIGERKKGERIYDYDVYNDLGNPDDSEDMARPVLGGYENPYPRRCRTGRPLSKIDPSSETRSSSSFYVPRDEEFSPVKNITFHFNIFFNVLHTLIPALESYLKDDEDLGFPYFTAVDSLYNEGIDLPPLELNQGRFGDLLPNLFKNIIDIGKEVLRFETPSAMERDKFFWLSDEEFARQTVAGLNPCKLELVTEWPPKSSLDPAVYGPPESAITTEMVEREIRGFTTVEEAVKQKKLFMLDYHDLLLPFVSTVRELGNTTLYGSRALFFLTPENTLTPVAIELVRPPMDGKLQWKEAYTPSSHATDGWLWRLAKAHVLVHDTGYHQLISHWLRTHCSTEPYIIAANRQLSEMHPIYRLLHPHFRYTMEINALARKSLINAGGVIESCFSPGKYSMLLSSVIYDKEWRFDHQALPKDLISRGLAVEDPSAPHGLKLTIEDYPYANDGLVLWDILKDWASDYVNFYYPNPKVVLEDKELQAWWKEVRDVGHGDKKDEPWWPELKTPADLIEILTTIMWTASGHHAAVNFGQYAYAGYFPNRPTIARINMPTEDGNPEFWDFFQKKPEAVILTTFPSQLQAVKTMAVLNTLSNHSPDEQYIGQEIEPAWVEEPYIREAFEKFHGRLIELEGIIDERNADSKLKNRNGVGVLPYELLKPNSGVGVTGKGVPYSISI